MKEKIKNKGRILRPKRTWRMRINHTQGTKLKMKISAKVLVIGFSALILTCSTFVYLNISQVDKSNASAKTTRIIEVANLKNSLNIESQVVLPMEQQPAGRNNPGVENKRKAVALNQK